MRQKRVEGVDLSKLERYPLEGTVIRVVDGDTIELRQGRDKTHVRLAGIDAPETPKEGKPGQQGAGGSIAYLTSVINNYRSNLELWVVPGEKTRGRLVGVLVVGALNVNLALVKRGLATSYAPGEGAASGIKMGAYRAAEKRAMAAREGLFALGTYRAQVLLNRSKGDVANVQISDPERLANSFSARVRARAIDGLRSPDHSRNVPHAIQGMNPNRGDFGGGRDIGNVKSMGLITEELIGHTLGSDYGAWREAVQYLSKLAGGSAGFQFADIETTGLRAADPIIEAAYSRITGMGAQHYNWAINPRLPITGDPNDLLVALSTAYESPLNEAVRKRLMYPGSGTVPTIPTEEIARLIPGGQSGAPLTFQHVESMLQASKFGAAQEQLAQIQGLVSSGRTAEMSDVLSLMFQESNIGRQFLFIQNPRFEASKWAPHMSDSMFADMLQTGGLAAGSPTYKSVYQQFDTTLAKHAEEAFRIERAGKLGASELKAAAQARSKWYGQLRKLIDSGAGKGTATIDIQDITRAVFGMAGLVDSSAATVAPGLLSQDVVGRMLGLTAEAHVALPDALQSQIVVAKLFQMGDAFQQALATGDSTVAAMHIDKIKQAAHMQKALGMFNIFKDLGQRATQMGELGIPMDQMLATWKGKDLAELKRKGGVYYIDGKAIPAEEAPRLFYAGGEVEEITLREYGKRRLMATVPNVTEAQAERMSKEMLDLAVQSPDTVGRYAAGDIYSLIERGIRDPGGAGIREVGLGRLGGRIAAFEGDPRDMPAQRHFDDLMRQLKREVKRDVNTKKSSAMATGNTGKDVMDLIGKNIGELPTTMGRWWRSLPPGSRRGLGWVAGGVAVLGGLGIIRGMFEEEQQAQPQTVDIEGYFANRQIEDAAVFMTESVDMREMLAGAHQTSGAMLTSRKDPSRYYGSRV